MPLSYAICPHKATEIVDMSILPDTSHQNGEVIPDPSLGLMETRVQQIVGHLIGIIELHLADNLRQHILPQPHGEAV